MYKPPLLLAVMSLVMWSDRSWDLTISLHRVLHCRWVIPWPSLVAMLLQSVYPYWVYAPTSTLKRSV
jgi:hypothetical protein